MYCARKKNTILIGNQYKRTFITGGLKNIKKSNRKIVKLQKLNYRNNLIGQDDHTTSKLEDVSKEQEEDKQGCKELLEVSHLYIRRLKIFHCPFIFGGIFMT